MVNNPENVTDRQNFSEFISYLSENIEDGDQSLKHFLETLSVYTRDISGYYKNNNMVVNPDQPSWRVFADILKGATLYE